VHAAEEYASRPRKNILSQGNINRIVQAYRTWSDEDRFSRIVDLSEISENAYNLNISRYVDTLAPEEPADIAAAVSRLRKAEQERDAAAARMDTLLKEMGYVS
jgi:type I restriction enzyme M protein